MSHLLNYDDFDYKYYINENPDVIKFNILTHQQAYKHWKHYGCYEGRKYRNIKTGYIGSLKLNKQQIIKDQRDQMYKIHQIHQIHQRDKGENKLRPLRPLRSLRTPPPLTQRKKTPPLTPITKRQSPITKTLITTPLLTQNTTKIAITLFIYDINMIKYFKSKIDIIINKYGSHNIHLYVGIKTYENRFVKDIENVEQYTKEQFNYRNIYIQIYDTVDNSRGGDIGGYLQLTKYASSQYDYKWYIILQSKTNLKWRNDLVIPLLNTDLSKFDDNIGLIGSSRWMLDFNLNTNTKYNYHFQRLIEIMGISWEQFSKMERWSFVGGSIFIINNTVVNYLNNYNTQFYSLLNTHHSIDINWINNLAYKDRKNCNNDYEYRVKYKKSLLSDYMIEHTFERFIGYIVKHLNLRVIKT